jgi:hypothetical protein
LGITTPSELSGRDPYTMYDDLCRITGQRHDPCLPGKAKYWAEEQQ